MGAAQDALISALGIRFLVIFGGLVLAIIFAGMNLTAKRARDAGLPGWMTVLALFVISFALSVIISEHASNVVSGICSLALLLLPPNTFGAMA